MRCFYCGTVLTTAPAARSPRRASVDHLTPLSRGGRDKRNNKVRACQACNRDKGPLTLEEYRVIKLFRAGKLNTNSLDSLQLVDRPCYEFWGERQLRERKEKNAECDS